MRGWGGVQSWQPLLSPPPLLPASSTDEGVPVYSSPASSVSLRDHHGTGQA